MSSEVEEIWVKMGGQMEVGELLYKLHKEMGNPLGIGHSFRWVWHHPGIH